MDGCHPKERDIDARESSNLKTEERYCVLLVNTKNALEKINPLWNMKQQSYKNTSVLLMWAVVLVGNSMTLHAHSVLSLHEVEDKE